MSSSISWAVRMYRVELGRSLRRWRTWVLAALLAAVPILLVIGLLVDPPPAGADDGFITITLRNGLFTPVAGLALVMPFLLPLAASLLAGDAIAGEASTGTLRYLLVRPVRRVRLVLGKYAAIVALLAGGVVVLVVAAVLTGGWAFGIGPLPALSGTTLSLPESALRIGAAALYCVAAMAGLAAVGLFISTLTESGPGATAATLAVAIVGQIVGALSSLELVHPYLINHYWLRFFELFRSPVPFEPVGAGLGVFATYSVVFVGLAVVVMVRKDVTS